MGKQASFHGVDENAGGKPPADGDLTPLKKEGDWAVKGHSRDLLDDFSGPQTKGFKAFGASVARGKGCDLSLFPVGQIPKGEFFSAF